MDALPEKYLEVKQTLLALIVPIRKMKGCLSHNIFLDIENDNGLSLIEEWESREDLDDHLQSEKFTLLMGIRYLMRRCGMNPQCIFAGTLICCGCSYPSRLSLKSSS